MNHANISGPLITEIVFPSFRSLGKRETFTGANLLDSQTWADVKFVNSKDVVKITDAKADRLWHGK